MSEFDLLVVLRHRKAVTYGFHVLLGALGEHGVHATAEPVQTLDAGWDVAAIGEGESTLLSLVDAQGDPTGVTGLAHRDESGQMRRTGKARQRPLDDFPGFALKWNKFIAPE
ncbi:MAG TPA: hypothetical protein VFW27_28225 [Actinoplanes sp.]|nr:hypothetical protein [Actinoplanes sp.]